MKHWRAKELHGRRTAERGRNPLSDGLDRRRRTSRERFVRSGENCRCKIVQTAPSQVSDESEHRIAFIDIVRRRDDRDCSTLFPDQAAKLSSGSIAVQRNDVPVEDNGGARVTEEIEAPIFAFPDDDATLRFSQSIDRCGQRLRRDSNVRGEEHRVLITGAAKVTRRCVELIREAWRIERLHRMTAVEDKIRSTRGTDPEIDAVQAPDLALDPPPKQPEEPPWKLLLTSLGPFVPLEQHNRTVLTCHVAGVYGRARFPDCPMS